MYAAPQKIVTITGTDEEDLINQIKKYSKEIVNIYKDADIKSVQRNILKDYWNPSKIETFNKKGFSLKIPRTYSKVEDNGDIVWYRYHLDRGNSMELFAYTVPITSEDDENGNTINLRDSQPFAYLMDEK